MAPPEPGTPSNPVLASYAITDPSFLHELMLQQFSSPSTYPAFANPAPPPFDDNRYQDTSYTSPHPHASTTQTSDCMGLANDATNDVPDSPSQQFQAGPSANTTQNTDFSSLLDTQPSLGFHDLIDDDQGATQTASTSFSETMPPTLRRRPSAIIPLPKRRRGCPPERHRQATGQESVTKPLAPEEDLFGDGLEVPALPKDELADENLTTIDLTDATEVPAELKKPIVDTRIKLGAFQCAICMDDTTGLTVTHCGKSLSPFPSAAKYQQS